jgi:hypothetical protein
MRYRASTTIRYFLIIIELRGVLLLGCCGAEEEVIVKLLVFLTMADTEKQPHFYSTRTALYQITPV